MQIKNQEKRPWAVAVQDQKHLDTFVPHLYSVHGKNSIPLEGSEW